MSGWPDHQITREECVLSLESSQRAVSGPGSGYSDTTQHACLLPSALLCGLVTLTPSAQPTPCATYWPSLDMAIPLGDLMLSAAEV